jgi:hypothetical protein
MPVILATQEAENRRIKVERPYFKNNNKNTSQTQKKGCWSGLWCRP